MKTRTAFVAAALSFTAALSAQPAPAGAPVDFAALMSAQPDERTIIPALKAVVFLSAPPAAGDASTAARAGVDASRVPLLGTDLFQREIAPFLNRPASLASLDRLQTVIRIHLQLLGRPLASVSLPPQDVTDGTVRIVVQLAALEGGAQVAGARWFSERGYAGAVQARGGEPLDLAAINADIAWLNRNPFRHVSASAEAGAAAGTTRLVLRTEETLPFQLGAGCDNTGTSTTGEERISASVQWGNAFGRGDLLGYRFAGDPRLEHMRSHALDYTAFLPWRHLLSLLGTYADLSSVMPEPFTQTGTSWQIGANYEVPLPDPRPGWTQSLNFTADFKYSDNTLEFDASPVTGNITHIVQFGATYGVTLPKFGGRNAAAVTIYASPGDLSPYNNDTAFNGSRPGAKAEYLYGKLNLSHQRPLGLGLRGSVNVSAQFASGALLGSEQLSGTGTYAVRGYPENSAFGDWGVVVNSELHAPSITLPAGHGGLDVFAFFDAASLNLRVDHQSTELGGAGLGVNVHIRNHVALRAAYGWQLKRLDAGGDSGHAHLGATLSW